MEWVKKDGLICEMTNDGLYIKDKLLAKYGDYVVKVGEGEFYPESADMFNRIYEKCE